MNRSRLIAFCLPLFVAAALAEAPTLVTPPAAGTAAMARGGQSADDCPPGNNDPDCKGK